jgi:hypothetical protein
LTDFSAAVTENAMGIADLRARVEELEAWKAEAENASETASAGV